MVIYDHRGYKERKKYCKYICGYNFYSFAE